MVENLVEPLFQPLTFGSCTIANRITMSAMSRYLSPGGVPGPDVAAYYRRRAEGGVGLILTEGTGVDHPLALDSPSIPTMHGEAALKGWKVVVDEVHRAGGVIFPQLWHQGILRGSFSGEITNPPGLRPSGLWGPVAKHAFDPAYVEKAALPTRPMSDSEVADAIAAYGRSAGHAAKVGFDGIAIHGAHGYLIDSFFWAATNQRTDIYGGDRRSRARFGAEVVKAIREAVGPDLPILFRFSQHKQQDYLARLADTPAELAEVLEPLVDAGVDVFDASARYFDEPAFEGSPINLAGWAKKVTGKLSMTVGSVGLSNGLENSLKSGGGAALNNIPEAVKRFLSGEFDLLGVGRALLSDLSFAQTMRAGGPYLPFKRDALAQLV